MKKLLKPYKRLMVEDEEDKSETAIKDLIAIKTVTDENDQGKMMALLRGLVFGDNSVADKFLTALNDWTTSLKIEDFKESKNNRFVKVTESNEGASIEFNGKNYKEIETLLKSIKDVELNQEDNGKVTIVLKNKKSTVFKDDILSVIDGKITISKPSYIFS